MTQQSDYDILLTLCCGEVNRVPFSGPTVASINSSEPEQWHCMIMFSLVSTLNDPKSNRFQENNNIIFKVICKTQKISSYEQINSNKNYAAKLNFSELHNNCLITSGT